MILTEWSEHLKVWILTASIAFDSKEFQVKFALSDLDWIYHALADMMEQLEMGVIYVQNHTWRGRPWPDFHGLPMPN